MGVSDIYVRLFGEYNGSEDDYFRRMGVSKAFHFDLCAIRQSPGNATEDGLDGVDEIERMLDRFHEGVMKHVHMYGKSSARVCQCCERSYGKFVPYYLFRQFTQVLQCNLSGVPIAMSDTHFVMGSQIVCWKQVEPLVFVSTGNVVFDFNLCRDAFGYYFRPGYYSIRSIVPIERLGRYCNAQKVSDPDVMNPYGKLYVEGQCGLFGCRFVRDYLETHTKSYVRNFEDVGKSTICGLPWVRGKTSREYFLEAEKLQREREEAVLRASTPVEEVVQPALVNNEVMLSEPFRNGVKLDTDAAHLALFHETDNMDSEKCVIEVSNEDALPPLHQECWIEETEAGLTMNRFCINVDQVMRMITPSSFWWMSSVDEGHDLLYEPLLVFEHDAQPHDISVVKHVTPIYAEEINDTCVRSEVKMQYCYTLGNKCLSYMIHKYSIKASAEDDIEHLLEKIGVELRVAWENEKWFVTPEGRHVECMVSIETLLGYIYLHRGEYVLLAYMAGISDTFRKLSLTNHSLGHTRFVAWAGIPDSSLDTLSKLGRVTLELFLVMDVWADDGDWLREGYRKRLDAALHALKEYKGKLCSANGCAAIGWYVLFWYGELSCVLEKLDVLRPKHPCSGCCGIDLRMVAKRRKRDVSVQILDKVFRSRLNLVDLCDDGGTNDLFDHLVEWVG
jgi:hypothetical protein